MMMALPGGPLWLGSAARSRSRSASVSPPTASAPALRNVRRDRPSPNAPCLSPHTVSMAPPPHRSSTRAPAGDPDALQYEQGAGRAQAPGVEKTRPGSGRASLAPGDEDVHLGEGLEQA